MSIILAVTYLFIIFINYKVYNNFYIYKSGKIMLTSIPYVNKDDEDVQEIVKEGKKKFVLINIVFTLAAGLLFIKSTRLVVNLFIWLILLYVGVFAYFANISMKKMRKLKAERGFVINKKKYVDLTLSNEVEKLRLGKRAWIIPIVIFAIGILLNSMIFGKKI